MNLFAGVHCSLETVTDRFARLPESVCNVARREGVRVDVNIPSGFALLRAAGLVDDAQIERIHRVRSQSGANLWKNRKNKKTENNDKRKSNVSKKIGLLSE